MKKQDENAVKNADENIYENVNIYENAGIDENTDIYMKFQIILQINKN